MWTDCLLHSQPATLKPVDQHRFPLPPGFPLGLTLTLEPLHGLLKESSGVIYFPEQTASLGRAFQPSPSLISPCVQPEHAISPVIGFNTLFSYEASKNGAIPNCLGASGAHPAHEFPDTLGFSFS